MCVTEFVNLFLCTVNVNNNIEIRRYVVSKNSYNYVMSFSLEKRTRYLVEVTKLMFVAVAQARVRAIIK